MSVSVKTQCFSAVSRKHGFISNKKMSGQNWFSCSKVTMDLRHYYVLVSASKSMMMMIWWWWWWWWWRWRWRWRWRWWWWWWWPSTQPNQIAHNLAAHNQFLVKIKEYYHNTRIVYLLNGIYRHFLLIEMFLVCLKNNMKHSINNRIWKPVDSNLWRHNARNGCSLEQQYV